MPSERGAREHAELQRVVAVDQHDLLDGALGVGLHPHLDLGDRRDLQAAQVEPLDAGGRLGDVVRAVLRGGPAVGRPRASRRRARRPRPPPRRRGRAARSHVLARTSVASGLSSSDAGVSAGGAVPTRHRARESGSSSTTWNWARSTRCTTSCAMRSPREIFAGASRVVVDQVDQDLAPVAGVDRAGRVEHRHAEPGGQAGARVHQPDVPLGQRDGDAGAAPGPARPAGAPRPRRPPGRRRRRRDGRTRQRQVRVEPAHGHGHDVGHGLALLVGSRVGPARPVAVAALSCRVPGRTARRTLGHRGYRRLRRAVTAAVVAVARPGSGPRRCSPPRSGWAPSASAPGCRSWCCSR